MGDPDPLSQTQQHGIKRDIRPPRTLFTQMQQRNSAKSYTQTGFSAKDLRLRLFDALDRSGATDRLKSQLRSALVTELKVRALGLGITTDNPDSHIVPVSAEIESLKLHENGPITPLPSFVKRKGESNLRYKLIDTLIIEYLKKREYEFTLSVFVPESGLTKRDQLLTEMDVLRCLHLDQPHRSLCRSMGVFGYSGRNISSEVD
ncbi:hypothetical protein BJ742DRAFT_164866 [Cladochytrium replicatum]|nr:hypothetical protein BJ742DRAFT_164866 [Cladochytrium replicatum]